MNSEVLLTINGWAGKNAWLDAVMVFSAAWLIYIIFAVAAACLAYCAYKRQWKPLVYFVGTLAITFVVLKLMELLNLDHRPFMDHTLTQLLPHEPGQSFPSDHTTSGVAVALAILVFTRFKKIGATLLAAACLVGFSRIYVGVHYPADIIGGIVTGAIGCGIAFATSRFVERRRNTEPKQQE